MWKLQPYYSQYILDFHEDLCSWCSLLAIGVCEVTILTGVWRVYLITFTGADGPHPTIQIHGCRHGHDLWQGVSWQRWLPDCRGGQRPATSHPAPGGQVSPTRTEQVHGANCWAVGHLDTGEGTVTVTIFKIKYFLLTCIGLYLYWQIGPSGKFIIAFQAPVQCCFMSTETVRTIRDGEPRMATSSFKQLPSSVL